MNEYEYDLNDVAREILARFEHLVSFNWSMYAPP